MCDSQIRWETLVRWRYCTFDRWLSLLCHTLCISSTENQIWCCAAFSIRDLSCGPSLQPPLTAVCLCLLVPREMVLQSSRESLWGPDCKVPATGQPLVQYGEWWQWHAAADWTCAHVRHKLLGIKWVCFTFKYSDYSSAINISSESVNAH